MPLLSALGVRLAARCRDKGYVVSELLTGCRSRQEAKHYRQVVHGGDQSFDSHNGNVHRGQGGDHSSVALVSDDAKRAALCHTKIHSGEANWRAEENIAQAIARNAVNFADLGQHRFAKLIAERLGNLLLC